MVNSAKFHINKLKGHRQEKGAPELGGKTQEKNLVVSKIHKPGDYDPFYAKLLLKWADITLVTEIKTNSFKLFFNIGWWQS